MKNQFHTFNYYGVRQEKNRIIFYFKFLKNWPELAFQKSYQVDLGISFPFSIGDK
jgi:hypothetical protein